MGVLMPKILEILGVTSKIIRIKILDSSSTVGAGLAGLTYASTGLVISAIADNEASPTYYTVAAGTIESITTIGTYETPTVNKCRFKEVSASYHPGVYEIHLANARYAVSGARSLIVSVFGATNCVQCDAEIQMIGINLYDAVRAGLSALPNANADAAGGLPISDLGGLDLDNISSTITTIAGDVVNIDGEAMRGTDGANTTTPPTSAAIADAVWDELLAEHLTALTTGKGLNDAQAAGNPWASLLPASYTTGQAGYILGTELKTMITAVGSLVSSVLAELEAMGLDIDDIFDILAAIYVAIGINQAEIRRIITTSGIANENITITRFTEGSWDGGHYVPGISISLTGTANIQPLNGRDLLQLAEGDRLRESIKVFTEVVVEDDDELTRENGDVFELQNVKDWRDHLIPHLKAVGLKKNE